MGGPPLYSQRRGNVLPYSCFSQDHLFDSFPFSFFSRKTRNGVKIISWSRWILGVVRWKDELKKKLVWRKPSSAFSPPKKEEENRIQKHFLRKEKEDPNGWLPKCCSFTTIVISKLWAYDLRSVLLILVHLAGFAPEPPKRCWYQFRTWNYHPWLLW